MSDSKASTSTSTSTSTITISRRAVSDIDGIVEDMKRNGVVIVANLLNSEQVAECRAGYHADLKKFGGVDYDDIKNTCHNLPKIQTHPSGGMPFHYSPWRMKHCILNRTFFHVTTELWKNTYAISAEGFECPHAPFPTDRGYAFLDSLNFRIPTELTGPADAKDKDKLQKSLAHHIDVNPWDKWGGSKGKTRWRPWQGFIALTNYTGGFECCPGFHTELDTFFSNIPHPKGHNHGFIALQGKLYKPIINRFVQVPYEAGDAVLWDWRTPHRVANIHPGPDTREVVYTSFLPDIPINRNYAAKQWAAIQVGKYPPGYSGPRQPKSDGPAMMGSGDGADDGEDDAKTELVPGWEPSVVENLDDFAQGVLGMTPWTSLLPDSDSTAASSVASKGSAQ